MSNIAQSSKVLLREFERDSWDGFHQFSNVYTCQFPFPEVAKRMVQVMFNENAIYMTRVDYLDDYSIYILSSTRPIGQSDEEEFETQKNRVMQMVNSLGDLIKAGIQKVPIGFGEAVYYDLKNVAIDNEKTIFPLELSFYNKKSIETISSHVIFSLGNSRIEVVGLRVASKEPGSGWEAQTVDRLQTFRQKLLATMGYFANMPESGSASKLVENSDEIIVKDNFNKILLINERYILEDMSSSEPSLEKTPSTYVQAALGHVIKSMVKTEPDNILKDDLIIALPYFKSAIKVAKVYSLSNHGKQNYARSGKSPMSLHCMFQIAISCNQSKGYFSTIVEIIDKIKTEKGAEFEYMINHLNEKLDADINFLRTAGSDELTEKIYKSSVFLNNKEFFDLVYEKANSYKVKA